MKNGKARAWMLLAASIAVFGAATACGQAVAGTGPARVKQTQKLLLTPKSDRVAPMAVVRTEGKVEQADALLAEDGKSARLIYEAGGPKPVAILDFDKPGEDEFESASYGVTYLDGSQWHMFYLGTPNVSGPPNLIPSFPYLTTKAKGESPAGPGQRQPGLVSDLRTGENKYLRLVITRSPDHISRVWEVEFLRPPTGETQRAKLSGSVLKSSERPMVVVPLTLSGQSRLTSVRGCMG